MTEELDLPWIVTAEAWDLERRMDEVVKALASFNKGSEPNVALAAALNVLTKAAENQSTADALAPMQTKALVSVALATVRKAVAEQASLSRVVRRLASMPEYAGLKPLVDLGTQVVGVEMISAPPADLEPQGVEGLPPSNAIEEWVADRDALSRDERASRDVDFLRAYGSRRLPASFAEALYVDDELWETPALQGWIETLDKPFDPEIIGIASSALLNARLRHTRPRLFLRSPQSLVVQPIASTEGRDQLEAEFRRDLGRTTATLIHQIKDGLETETDRSSIRKTELKTLINSLAGVFQRLQFEERPARGDVVAFDPVMHDADTDEIQLADQVVVRSSGLSDAVTKEVLTKPMVTRIRERAPAAEARRTNDTQTEGLKRKAGSS